MSLCLRRTCELIKLTNILKEVYNISISCYLNNEF